MTTEAILEVILYAGVLLGGVVALISNWDKIAQRIKKIFAREIEDRYHEDGQDKRMDGHEVRMGDIENQVKVLKDDYAKLEIMVREHDLHGASMKEHMGRLQTQIDSLMNVLLTAGSNGSG